MQEATSNGPSSSLKLRIKLDGSKSAASPTPGEPCMLVLQVLTLQCSYTCECFRQL